MTIIPPLAPGDSLTAGGCSAPAGVSLSIGAVLGHASPQLLSIAASQQAGSGGTLTCGTTAGRTIRAQIEFGYEETVVVSAYQESGATYDVNVSTQGFSEVDRVLLIGTDGTDDEGDDEEDNGDVTEDFTTSIPVGQCVYYSAFIWGYTENGDSGPAYASGSALACDEYEPPPSYTLSGTVLASNGKPLKGINITAILGSATTFATTDVHGQYSISLNVQSPGCPSLGVGVSFGSPYTIPFTPSSGFFPCVQSDLVQNFTAAPFTTVFVIHGIGQGSTGVQSLASNLAYYGVDTSRFYVDGGFDFNECANAQSCSMTNATTSMGGTLGPTACSVPNGAIKLADYILNVSGRDPGRIVLVGYSMGGLLARTLLVNGYTSAYQNVLSTNTVAGLITLGTPNWGYANMPFDGNFMCPQLLTDMAGAWNTLSDTANNLSNALNQTNGPWTPSSYGGYWLAAAGRFCSNQTRVNISNPGGPPFNGCYEPTGVYSNDGVVCADSAEYTNNPAPQGAPTSVFDDSSHLYAHTNTLVGFGTALMMGCNSSGTKALNTPLFTDDLFKQIAAVINGN